MKNKRPTVTIGIPAYNEASTLPAMLDILSSQAQKNYKLAQILIVSDGSTDATGDIAKNYGKLVDLIVHRVRRGKPQAVNTIFSHATSDVVIILDADLKIQGQHVVEKLVAPMLDNPRVQLTSALAAHERVHNLASRIALASNQIWEKAITFPPEHELYLCSGSIRAFGKKLYKRLHFHDYSADDAYAYLACRYYKYDFAYVSGLPIMQKLPTTIGDFLSQTRRFLQSQSIQNKMFSPQFVNQYYTVTWKEKLKGLAWYAFQDPLAELFYVLLRGYVAVENVFIRADQSSLWHIVRSTKDNV